MIPKLMMYVGGRFPAITPANNIGQVVIIISDFSGRNNPITFFKLTAMIRILNWNSYFFGGIILGTYILIYLRGSIMFSLKYTFFTEIPNISPKK